MAKKEKNTTLEAAQLGQDNIDVPEEVLTDAKKKKKERKKKKSIVPLVVSILILAGVVGVAAFNVFNIRDQYLYPVARNIPIVKNIIPAAAVDDTEGLTKEQLIAENRQLQEQVAQQTKDYDDLKTRFDDRGKELQQLQSSTDVLKVSDFSAKEQYFDEQIAGKDVPSFVDFYEKISPENADRIYREVINSRQNEKQMKHFINTFQSMDETSAAKILEEMLGTEMNLVVDILNQMDTETSASILAAMSTTNAAAVARRMAPETQPVATAQ